VFTKWRLVPETFVTVAAFVRLLIRMDLHVVVQLVFTFKAATTFCTFKRCVTGMWQLMDVQPRLGWKWFLANITGVKTDASVNSNVCLQGEEQAVPLSTHFAPKTFTAIVKNKHIFLLFLLKFTCTTTFTVSDSRFPCSYKWWESFQILANLLFIYKYHTFMYISCFRQHNLGWIMQYQLLN